MFIIVSLVSFITYTLHECLVLIPLHFHDVCIHDYTICVICMWLLTLNPDSNGGEIVENPSCRFPLFKFLLIYIIHMQIKWPARPPLLRFN